MDDEMSGEFGDNVSVCSRRKSVVITDDDNVIISKRKKHTHTHTYIFSILLDYLKLFMK